jgi:hypothetical protein
MSLPIKTATYYVNANEYDNCYVKTSKDAVFMDDDETKTLGEKINDIDETLENHNTQLSEIPNQTYITEKAKTVDMNNALALKASTSYVDTKVGNMGNTKTFKGSCTNAELSTKTGMTVDDYWYITDLMTNKCYNGTSWIDIGNNLKFGDKTVKRNNLYDYLATKNLFDIDSCVTGLLGSTGVVDTNASYITTDFIPITPNINYVLSGSGGGNVYGIYDANKTWISRIVSNGDMVAGFVTNVNAYYIRISVDSSKTNFQFEQGSTKTTYAPYGWIMNKLQSQEVITARGSYVDLNSRITAILLQAGLRTNLNDFLYGKNLIDSDSFTTGMLGTNGTPYVNGTYVTTDYISITPNTNYVLSGSGGGNLYCYYDSNNTLLDSRVVLNATLTSGAVINISNASAKYIRISIDSAYANFQFEQGSTKTTYAPYYWKLNKLQLQEILDARGSYDSLNSRLNSIPSFDLSKMKNAYIKNCRLVCNNGAGVVTAKYAGVDFGTNANITMMRAKVIFNVGSDGATVALINNATGCTTIEQIVAGSLHIVFTDTHLSLGLYQNSVNNVVYNYTYSNPCLKDGSTEYEFGWVIDKSTNTITFWTPDGYKTYQDSGDMVALMGQYCILEHYFNTGVTCPDITWFYVKNGSTVLLEDDFTRPDGAVGVAPTGSLYHLYHEID